MHIYIFLLKTITGRRFIVNRIYQINVIKRSLCEIVFVSIKNVQHYKLTLLHLQKD